MEKLKVEQNKREFFGTVEILKLCVAWKSFVLVVRGPPFLYEVFNSLPCPARARRGARATPKGGELFVKVK